MTQPMSTRDVVDALLQRIATGDPTEIAELYADQVDWKLGWPEDEHGTAVPWIRHRSTRADVEDHYRTLGDYHLPSQASVDIAAILVDGADAAIIGELSQTPRATGVTYRAAFALYLTVSDGVITRHHILEDSLAVKRAFELPRDTEPTAGSGSHPARTTINVRTADAGCWLRPAGADALRGRARRRVGIRQRPAGPRTPVTGAATLHGRRNAARRRADGTGRQHRRRLRVPRPTNRASTATTSSTTHLFRAVRDGRVTATAHPLQQHGVETVVVQVHPQHDASMAVARAVGLAATERVIDGEVR